jgi:N-acetylmuramoyl-L-alanine amidase
MNAEQAIAAGAGARRISYVVIHTEGDGVNNDTSAADIRQWHMTPKPKGPGWRDIGYNFWIRFDGTVELGRPLAQVPAHAEGFNVRSIGVGLAGDGDLADFTPAQYDALFDLCWALADRFSVPWAHFIGHREVPAHGGAWTSKHCPGRLVDLNRFRVLLAEPR